MRLRLFIPLIAILSFSACQENYIPKPKGYFRIDTPKKEYVKFQSNCGFNFDVPIYSEIEKFKGEGNDSCWCNVSYPSFNAKLHLTYLPIEGELSTYLEDAHQFAFKHEIKATAINSTKIEAKENDVSGLIYDIKGNVATSLQFFATDSVHHFLRGSLYFMNTPNEDSIAPVLSYLREDVVQMIESLHWNPAEE